MSFDDKSGEFTGVTESFPSGAEISIGKPTLTTAEPIMTQGCLVRPPQHILDQQALTGERVVYSMYHVEAGQETSALIDAMLLLQDQICKVKAPDVANALDYKTRAEFEDHFTKGNQALVITVNGDLAGICLMEQTVEDNISKIFQRNVANEPRMPSAIKVGFLAVDPVFQRNMLANGLLQQVEKIAEDYELEAVIANARLWNKNGIKRFSESGFVGVCLAENKKDGSSLITMAKAVNERLQFDTVKGWDSLMSDGVEEKDRLERALDSGQVVSWHQAGRCMALYTPPKPPQAVEEYVQPVEDLQEYQHPTEDHPEESQPAHMLC